MMVTMSQLRAAHIGGALDAVRDAGSGHGPIVVGPWLGEVGFELLYWIPFLRWALAEAAIPRERLVVVSRGGCAHWYADLAGTYVELFDHLSPGELRVINRERIAEQASAGQDFGLHRGQMTAKQYGVTRAEREILQRVGLEGADLIHPSIMFRLFRLYWRQQCRDLYTRCTRAQPMPLPPGPVANDEPYVAVKFYSSMACGDRAGTAKTVRQLVGLLAEVMPVVVLDSGDGYDDHGAFQMEHPRVTVLANLEPASNLSVQTAVIAHAAAFVGTYGGFAYLAPLLGVPTSALYADRTFRDDHYQAASSLFHRLGVYFEVSDLATGVMQLHRTGVRWLHAA